MGPCGRSPQRPRRGGGPGRAPVSIASPVVVYWDQWFGGKDKLKQH